MGKTAFFKRKPAPEPVPEPPKVRFMFLPEKNITAFELSQCMMHLLGKPINLDTDTKEKYFRHFQPEQPAK